MAACRFGGFRVATVGLPAAAGGSQGAEKRAEAVVKWPGGGGVWEKEGCNGGERWGMEAVCRLVSGRNATKKVQLSSGCTLCWRCKRWRVAVRPLYNKRCKLSRRPHGSARGAGWSCRGGSLAEQPQQLGHALGSTLTDVGDLPADARRYGIGVDEIHRTVAPRVLHQPGCGVHIE